jgi:isocitrate dehydrogenase (NAD+)
MHYAGELGHPGAHIASRGIYEAVFEACATGVKTPDLGGSATMSEFTDEVVTRVRTKVEIWSSLGSTV